MYYLTTKGKDTSGVRDVTLVTNICYQLAECLYATFCNQTWHEYPHELECHAQKWDLKGQGHSVGLYNQNMVVSTISFISSKLMSLLQPNSI